MKTGASGFDRSAKQPGETTVKRGGSPRFSKTRAKRKEERLDGERCGGGASNGARKARTPLPELRGPSRAKTKIPPGQCSAPFLWQTTYTLSCAHGGTRHLFPTDIQPAARTSRRSVEAIPDRLT
ncbi:hypothetical protein KM043_016017 [Ampulex compressa]|nr:hypothetical protein KM043_016017 [Ampulex compressa]